MYIDPELYYKSIRWTYVMKGSDWLDEINLNHNVGNLQEVIWCPTQQTWLVLLIETQKDK